MASQLFPLIYKPGIKRDGTPFQADYCTEGQWVRFQRGLVKKMGGMIGWGGEDTSIVSNITMLPTRTSDTNIITYLGDPTGIYRYTFTQNFIEVPNSYNYVYTANPVNNDYIWQSTSIINGNNSLIVFLGAPNKTNINNNAGTLLVQGSIYVEGNAQRLALVENVRTIGLSGLLYASPFLFLYGSEGLIQCSVRNNPLEFQGGTNNFTISNDKVIYAASIRGGTNSPAFLCWTLSSVVRLLNVGTNTEAFSPQIDVLSKTSSILSTRCVVEYDGVFFWPGTNRFFQYNGIVSELANVMNFNYFFDNIDMTFRQKVCGSKNTQYGEIWWFYPEKEGTTGRPNVPAGTNTRAIIYNVRENSWYDTAISRDAVTYSEDFGIFATYGKSLTDPINNNTFLWRHEYETSSNEPGAITEMVPTRAQPPYNNNPIISSVTTPTISWAAFNPNKQLTGVDRWVDIRTIEPDFLITAPAQISMQINTQEYALSPPQIYPIPPLPAYNIIQYNNNGEFIVKQKFDLRVQGRYVNFTFFSVNKFEMGHIILQLAVGDAQ